MANRALKELSGEIDKMYAPMGRPSILPEKLIRALHSQVLYSIRGEGMLMEQLNYNLLFRWFVGLSMDGEVWDHSTFSKNRERLLDGEIVGSSFPSSATRPAVRPAICPISPGGWISPPSRRTAPSPCSCAP